MEGSGSNSKAIALVVGGVALFGLLFYILHRMSVKMDAIADNQLARPKVDLDNGKAIDVTPETVRETEVNAPAPISAIVVQAPGNVAEPRFHSAHSENRMSESISEFRHSEDFRMVVANGTTHTLTLYQSRAFEKLWKARKNLVPEVHQAVLLEGIESCSKRLRDVFKSNMKAYRALIAPGERKGTFRINLS